MSVFRSHLRLLDRSSDAEYPQQSDTKTRESRYHRYIPDQHESEQGNMIQATHPFYLIKSPFIAVVNHGMLVLAVTVAKRCDIYSFAAFRYWSAVFRFTGTK